MSLTLPYAVGKRNEKCRGREGEAVGQTLSSMCRRAVDVAMPLFFPSRGIFLATRCPWGPERTRMPQERRSAPRQYSPPHHVPKSFSRRNIVRTAHKGPWPRPQSRAGSSHGVACLSPAEFCQTGPGTVSHPPERRAAVTIFGGLMTAPPRLERSSVVCKWPACRRRTDCAGASDGSEQQLSGWLDEAVPARRAGRGLA